MRLRTVFVALAVTVAVVPALVLRRARCQHEMTTATDPIACWKCGRPAL